MEQVIKCLERLIRSGTEDKSEFYYLLSDLKLKQEEEKTLFKGQFLPRLFYLIDRDLIRKDLVYLALLAGGNRKILEQILAYDKSVLVVGLKQPLSFYDYVVYEKKHFIYEIVKNCSHHFRHDRNVYHKLLMLRLIHLTNSQSGEDPDTELSQINSVMSQINSAYLDGFWKDYIHEIRNFLGTAQFICRNLADNKCCDPRHVFDFVVQHSLLTTFSEFVTLESQEKWGAVLNKLQLQGDRKEVDLFRSFALIADVVQKITLPNLSPTTDIATKILEIHSNHMQLEVLENLFSLLFYRTSDDHFACRTDHVKWLLTQMKRTTDELTSTKTFYQKDSPTHWERFENLKKILSDALWRLNLLSSLSDGGRFETTCMTYMLASPESIVRLCLRQDDFQKAYEVVEMFDLRTTEFGQEFEYISSLNQLRFFLMKHSGTSFANTLSTRMLDRFYKIERKDAATSRHFSGAEIFTNFFDFALTLARCRTDWQYLMRMAQPFHAEWSKTYPQFLKFYEKISDIADCVGDSEQIAPCVILSSPSYPLSVASYKANTEKIAKFVDVFDDFQEKIQKLEPGTLNKDHPAHDVFQELSNLCNLHYLESNKSHGNVKYMSKVFGYLHAFSKILTIQEDCSDLVAHGHNASYFEILKHNRAEIVGVMLFERRLEPQAFDQYFANMKLDFLYHMVGNCFPTINLHVNENTTIEELYHENMMYTPTKNILDYIRRDNWFLAFVLRLMYKIEEDDENASAADSTRKTDADKDDPSRVQVLLNYLNLPKIQILKPLYDNNPVITALQNCVNSHEIVKYVKRRIIKHELCSVKSDDSSVEIGEEIQEDTLTNWENLHVFLENIPENQMHKKADLIRLKDEVLTGLFEDGATEEYHKYVDFISSRDVRLELISRNFKRWYKQSSLDVVKCELSRFNGQVDVQSEGLAAWLPKIEFGEKLSNVLLMGSWYRAYCHCKDNGALALAQIIRIYDVELLLKFIEIFQPDEFALINVDLNYFVRIIEHNVRFKLLRKLFDALPFGHTINICNGLLTVVRNLKCLQFLVEYLLNNKVPDDVFVQNIEISLRILSVFSEDEQEHYFSLIHDPLSILEIQIMNTRLDKLGEILTVLDLGNKQKNNYEDQVIGRQKIDALLRRYAEKSLDFRVNTTQQQTSTKIVLQIPEDGALVQSVDSFSNWLIKGSKFFLPKAVPPKKDWVPNEKVTKCMCCMDVTFSMFNRRHHCRRCGRVVCYYCSTKRMLVSTYGDLLVRVCDDCYEQATGATVNSDVASVSNGGSTDSASFSRTCTQEYWTLNEDPEHNRITREEFSYEHAPSVPLCFSLLKYHSKNEEYSAFLLQQCDALLTLLRPSQEPTQEIDYLLVLNMLKTLAMAAKVHCDENGPEVDRILSQVELLGLLAQKGFLNLMPVLNTKPPYIDTIILRRLRERILQSEQWELALEVSTKAGMDNTGVFAAWGKKCLKIGKLLSAREKFHRCLEKTYEVSWSDTSRSVGLGSYSVYYGAKTSGGTSAKSDGPTTKDSPLLHEIIEILESHHRKIHAENVGLQRSKLAFSDVGSTTGDPVHTATSKPSPSVGQTEEPALEIMNRLKNLRNIKQGERLNLLPDSRNPPTKLHQDRPELDPVFYDECIYYLKRYGSVKTLVEFYMRHGNVDKAVHLIHQNAVNEEVFVNIYLRCLKDGTVNVLQEQMTAVDASLDSWKSYLHKTCCFLAKNRLMHSLHQTQLFMGDYVRAAITCFKFYTDNAVNFTSFVGNAGHLRTAEEHLKQYLQKKEMSAQTSGIVAKSPEKRSADAIGPPPVENIHSKDVHRHLNTIKKQLELSDFLSQCEGRDFDVMGTLKDIFNLIDRTSNVTNFKLPTLFDDQVERIALAALVIVSAAPTDDGLKFASTLIDQYKLKPLKVFRLAGREMVQTRRFGTLTDFVTCVKAHPEMNKDAEISLLLDELLLDAIKVAIDTQSAAFMVDQLTKLVHNTSARIEGFIVAKQLKSAYYIAIRHKRYSDLRKIQAAAEASEMHSLKRLCEKMLQNVPSSRTPGTFSKSRNVPVRRQQDVPSTSGGSLSSS